MNTNITREELFEKFVTKEYLHDELEIFGARLEEKMDRKFEAITADFRLMVVEIADMLNGKIETLDKRPDDHIGQNAKEHSKFVRSN